MAATLLKQGRLETALVGRGLEGFQRRVEVELQPSGVMELDAVLGGGFPVGLSWNCMVLLHRGGRVWLSLCLRRPRNVSRRARSLMSPILLTRCPSRLRAWTFRGCFGFGAEKSGTEDRMSKRLRTLLEWAKKQERHAALVPRPISQCKYMVGGIRVN